MQCKPRFFSVIGVLLVALSACTLSDLELNDRRCPCAPGWVCTPLNTCVLQSESLDAGSRLVDSALGIDSRPSDSAAEDSTIDSGIPPDSATDAGLADSTIADSSSLPGDTACDDEFVNALRCNSYDQSLPGWTPAEGTDSAIELSSEQAYRGPQSAKASTMDENGIAFVQEGWSAPITSGTIYARGYFYFPTVTEPNFADWLLMYLQANQSPFHSIGVQLNDTYVPTIVTVLSQTRGRGTQSIPADQWVCLQFTVDLAESDGAARLHVDGELFAELVGVRTLPEGGVDHMFSGVGWGGAGDSATVYMDEIVVDTSPVPCD